MEFQFTAKEGVQAAEIRRAAAAASAILGGLKSDGPEAPNRFNVLH
jgi:hypothetical protein